MMSQLFPTGFSRSMDGKHPPGCTHSLQKWSRRRLLFSSSELLRSFASTTWRSQAVSRVGCLHIKWHSKYVQLPFLRVCFSSSGKKKKGKALRRTPRGVCADSPAYSDVIAGFCSRSMGGEEEEGEGEKTHLFLAALGFNFK